MNIIHVAFVAEWSKASDSSSDIFGCVSSNLTECTIFAFFSPLGFVIFLSLLLAQFECNTSVYSSAKMSFSAGFFFLLLLFADDALSNV